MIIIYRTNSSAIQVKNPVCKTFRDIKLSGTEIK